MLTGPDQYHQDAVPFLHGLGWLAVVFWVQCKVAGSYLWSPAWSGMKDSKGASYPTGVCAPVSLVTTNRQGLRCCSTPALEIHFPQKSALLRVSEEVTWRWLFRWAFKIVLCWFYSAFLKLGYTVFIFDVIIFMLATLSKLFNFWKGDSLLPIATLIYLSSSVLFWNN